MFGQGINFGSLAPRGDEVDFLVLAGGGGGGSKELNGWGMSGGGGGAGGLRTSYGSTSGGGASAEDPIKLVSGTTYTITVGAGGAAGYSSNNPGADSSIIGGSVSLTSLGGGAGRGKWPGQPTSELDGGSGGGADNGSCTYGMCNSVRAGGSGTAGQGYTSTWNTCSYTAGGGGGAAGPGNNRYGGSPVICGWPGEGGNCLSVSITGSAVNYAAGGSSGYNTTNVSYYKITGKCGIAGGTAYVDGTRDGEDAPGVNKGSGGSGYSNINAADFSTDFRGGNGSSGVVILRLPTAIYSGTTTGSPTVTTDGTDTIIQFTGSGTYTH